VATVPAQKKSTISQDEEAQRKIPLDQSLKQSLIDRKKLASLVKQLVCIVDRVHLAATDAFGFNVVHYLAVNGYHSAYTAIEEVYPELCDSVPTRTSKTIIGTTTTSAVAAALSPGTPRHLLMKRTEVMMEITEEENRRLQHNIELAEGAAEHLQMMHEQLDMQIQRGQIHSALNQRNLETLAQEQEDKRKIQQAQLDAVAQKSAVQAECDETRAFVEKMRSDYSATTSRLGKYEAEIDKLKLALADEKTKVASLQQELASAKEENTALAALLKNRIANNVSLSHTDASTSSNNDHSQPATPRTEAAEQSLLSPRSKSHRKRSRKHKHASSPRAAGEDSGDAASKESAAAAVIVAASDMDSIGSDDEKNKYK
jgi:hypothetical protein